MDCEHVEQCMGEGRDGRYRGLLVVKWREKLERMREKVAGEAGREAMARDWGSVERVIGQIKCVMGLSRFRLAGLEGARIEFALACIAVNIKRLAR